MKNAVLLSAVFLLFLASCTEQDSPILGGSKTTDTTYIAAAENPQAHNMLIEEFTGSSCPNCPDARTVIEGLKATYGTKINVLSIHPFNIPQGGPCAGHMYDFRTNAGTTIGADIYNGIPALPEGGVDRAVYSSNLLLTRDAWPTAMAARTAVTSGINLYVTSHYNAAAGFDTITVTIAYTQALSTTQNISVAIVEDSLYDLQEDVTKIDTNYLYTDVFRDMVTKLPYGNPVLPTIASKEVGRVAKLYFLYPVSTTLLFNPKNCRVVAFVTDGTSGTIDVLQSAQTSFAGQ